MAAVKYYERTLLGSSLLSQLVTDITSQTDWTRPNSGTLPYLFKVTTGEGATFAVDLNSAALSVTTMTVQFFRNHDGTTATDASGQKYLRMKRTNSGTLAANTYHYTLSLGPEHFFLMVEGPRFGEANPDNGSAGSVRSYIFMSSLTRYYSAGADTTPCVVAYAHPSSGDPSAASGAHLTLASRNHLGTLAWVPGYLRTLQVPTFWSVNWNVPRLLGLSNNDVDADPLVWYDVSLGRRGRLSSFYHLGWNISTGTDLNLAQVNSVVTIGGQDYKVLAVSKSDNNGDNWGPFGAIPNGFNTSPIVAVPWAA